MTVKFLDPIQSRVKKGYRFTAKKIFAKHLGIFLLFIFALLVNIDNARILFAQEEEVSLDPALEAQIGENISGYLPYGLNANNLGKALVYESEFLEKPTIASPAEPELPPEPKTPAKELVYTIQSGETLSSIATKFNLKINTLKVYNNLTSDKLKPGQVVKIPTGDLSAAQIAKIQTKNAPKAVAKIGTQKITSREGYDETAGGFIRPTDGNSISQGYGHTKYERFHDGIDLDSRSGLNIYASKDGRVIETVRGWGSGYGNNIVIDHGGGWQTLYGHLSKILVGAGETVKTGQLIGIMGSSGWSTGTHLHFLVHKNGGSVNPFSVLP